MSNKISLLLRIYRNIRASHDDYVGFVNFFVDTCRPYFWDFYKNNVLKFFIS